MKSGGNNKIIFVNEQDIYNTYGVALFCLKQEYWLWHGVFNFRLFPLREEGMNYQAHTLTQAEIKVCWKNIYRAHSHNR